jgi:hypothetical protein
MSQFSGALESDNINNIMANFNIDPSPGMENLIRGKDKYVYIYIQIYRVKSDIHISVYYSTLITCISDYIYIYIYTDI